MIRLVIDASVLVSAAVGFPDSPSALLLDAVKAGQVEIVACDRLFSTKLIGLYAVDIFSLA